MKKVFLTAALFIAVAMGAAAQNNVTVTREGKTFTAQKTTKSDNPAKGYKPTGFTYIDTDGAAYEIHTHTTQKGEHAGETKCYIQKTSKKSGKEYWKMIPVKPEELKED